MSLSQLKQISSAFPNTSKMPVLFLGHGSPMNAIEENEFVIGFRNIANQIPQPTAILCISAHWETRGTFVTHVAQPRTIHDFGGFPPALYQVQYPASGHPELAKETKSLVKKTELGLDEDWGLDHGAWSVIKHLYPHANIPVVQLSLDYTQSPQYHYELAQELSALREKGILIIGSGNMVHNLRLVEWKKVNEQFAFDWAEEASTIMKNLINKGDHRSLIHYQNLGMPFQLSIPTPEHYLPLLYTLALKTDNEGLAFFNDKPLAGSLTMTSLKIGDSLR
jgi:4,5-DOPA dioxygenase extradiol